MRTLMEKSLRTASLFQWTSGSPQGLQLKCAEWCGPCKQIGPILEEISNEMSEVVIAKHNIDNEPNTPTKYGVRGIPTMLLFSGGELKATKVGATTKSNIVTWIKENI